MALRRRGYTSSYFPKVQYGMETRDASGQDLDVPFLGMPEESDWVLNAPYSDKSLLRNHVSMHLAREMGHWAPRTRLFELFLAGGCLVAHDARSSFFSAASSSAAGSSGAGAGSSRPTSGTSTPGR